MSGREEQVKSGRSEVDLVTLCWDRTVRFDVMDVPGRVQVAPYLPQIWSGYKGVLDSLGV